MVTRETFSRVQTLHAACRSSALRSAQCHQAADGRIQKTGRTKSEAAWPEAKTYEAFCFGPRGKRAPLVERLFPHLASEFLVRKPLAHDVTYKCIETASVSVLIMAIIVTKRLFVDVPEQVKRLHADIRSVKPALQETPEILHRVGMDIPSHVFNGVVDHRMFVAIFQSFVG